jgi:hypothetical protein
MFSHPVAERAPSRASVTHVQHEGLFREPEFAPDTLRPAADEPAHIRLQHNRQHNVRAQRRQTRNHRAA